MQDFWFGIPGLIGFGGHRTSDRWKSWQQFDASKGPMRLDGAVAGDVGNATSSCFFLQTGVVVAGFDW